MQWLNILPGHVRAAAGLEWQLWLRLWPWSVWSLLLSMLAGLVCAWWWPEPLRSLDGGLQPEFQRLLFVLVGWQILVWTLLFTAGIGCVIVMLMKGPAYVADPYTLPDGDSPR